MTFIDASSWNFAKIKWLDRHMMGHSGFIAGGCFKHIFTGEKVKDVDIFFTNADEWAKAFNYFRASEDYADYYENKKVSAFKCKKTGLVVELIKAVFGTPEEVIGNFDFTVTKFAYYKHYEETELPFAEPETPFDEEPKKEVTITYKCLYHPLFFEHLSLRRLVLDDKIPFPASTFERMFRYGKYGYFPCRETKVRMIGSLREMDAVPELSLALYDGLD